MKRSLIILILVATACSGKVTITEAEIKSDIFYADRSTQPFTGKCIVVFSDTGLVKEEFTYKKGILHGKATAWYKNGQIRRRGSYHMGQISGNWEFWDEKGRKTIEACYKNDVLNGSYMSLYANGKIREKGQFKDNKRTGQWVYYNEKGQPVPEESR
jgi:antitoxin component YwqK of YwqJK toxin-antitoxin module